MAPHSRTPWKTGAAAAGSVHRRHPEDGDDAPAWRTDTGPAGRLVEAWKGAVARAERDLVRVGCALAAVDLMAALAACFAPPLSPVLGLARLAGLVVFVPALLRTLAIRHADREDAELMKAIAVAVGAAAGYLVVRTWVVVRVCSL